VATADTIRVELIWKLSGVDWAVNVIHFTTGSAGALTTDNTASLASAIGTAFSAASLPADYPNEVLLDRALIRDLRTDGQQVWEKSINIVGTNSGNLLPAQTCIVSTLRTTTFSRRGRGRIYWPAPALGSSDPAGQVVAAAATRYSTFVTDLMSVTAGDLGTLVLAVLSRVDNTARTVTNVITDRVFDVQTRRRDLSIT
jgi:hypothetical protein